MFRPIIVAALLLLASGAVAASAADDGLRLVDLTDDFDREWTRTEALPDAERIRKFKSGFARLLPGFYAHERFGLPNSTRYDQHLLKALNAYPEQRAGIMSVSRRFDTLFKPARASFEAAFGRMSGYPPVYLVNSLGEFDGGTRPLPEGIRLLFGADMIDRLYKGRNVQPFFHHELFHLYHGRAFPECDAIWCALWTEGLAVYVSAELNRGASDADLLLDTPEPLRAAVEADRAHAICTVRSQLDSTAKADYAGMFTDSRLDDRLPPRFGYYVGYLVAAEVAKGRSLQALASLSHEQARPLIEGALKALAPCP